MLLAPVELLPGLQRQQSLHIRALFQTLLGARDSLLLTAKPCTEAAPMLCLFKVAVSRAGICRGAREVSEPGGSEMGAGHAELPEHVHGRGRGRGADALRRPAQPQPAAWPAAARPRSVTHTHLPTTMLQLCPLCLLIECMCALCMPCNLALTLPQRRSQMQCSSSISSRRAGGCAATKTNSGCPAGIDVAATARFHDRQEHGTHGDGSFDREHGMYRLHARCRHAHARPMKGSHRCRMHQAFMTF